MDVLFIVSAKRDLFFTLMLDTIKKMSKIINS